MKIERLLLINIVLLLLASIFLTVGRNDLATLFAFISFSIAIGMSFMLLYDIIMFIVGKGEIKYEKFLYPVLFAVSYFLAKKAVTGVIAEAMGAKGLLPAIYRIVGYLTGTYGSTIQLIGMWVGFIAFAAAFMIIVYSLQMAALGRITEENARIASLLGGFGIASGFVTAHLAQTGFLYPFTIVGNVYLNVPMFVFTLFFSVLSIIAALFIMIMRH